MDSQYVSRTLALCLSQGLAELIEQRPPDPIDFLALWILKYKQNQELQQQKSASQKQLEEEQRRIYDETLHQKLLQDEESRIRAAEDQLQSEPESADESKPSPPDQGEDQEHASIGLTDAVDQTESETLKESTDPPAEHQEADDGEPGEAATDEDQTSEIPNTERSQSQEDHRDTQKEADELEPEKTEEDPDERQTETEDKESEKPEEMEEKPEQEEEDGS